jgi:hypothetical protein
MLLKLIIKQEAHFDTINAYNYYEEKQPGLGVKFLHSLKERNEDLINHTYNYSFINEDENLKFRNVLLDTFPYLIVFEILNDEVVVYAIHNTNRDPKNKIRK